MIQINQKNNLSKTPINLIIFISLLINITCKQKISTKAPMASSLPEIIFSIGKIYDNGKNNKLLNQETKVLLNKVNSLVEAIKNHDTKEIINQLPLKGEIYIDLKAPTQRNKVIESIKHGAINRIFWQNSSKEFGCYQQIFSQLDAIELDFFFEGNQGVEIELKFANRPSLGIMGNLIYHKQKNQWKLMRLF